MHRWGKLAVKDGELYLADYENRRVRKVDTSGVISTVPGTGFQMSSPMPIAIAFYNNVLLIGSSYGIMSIDENAQVEYISVQDQSYGGDGQHISMATFNVVSDIQVTKNNDLYIVDKENYRIRKVDGNTNIVSTIAGNGFNGNSGDHELAVNASIGLCNSAALDDDENLYLVFFEQHTIRIVGNKTIEQIPQPEPKQSISAPKQSIPSPKPVNPNFSKSVTPSSSTSVNPNPSSNRPGASQKICLNPWIMILLAFVLLV